MARAAESCQQVTSGTLLIRPFRREESVRCLYCLQCWCLSALVLTPEFDLTLFIEEGPHGHCLRSRFLSNFCIFLLTAHTKFSTHHFSILRAELDSLQFCRVQTHGVLYIAQISIHVHHRGVTWISATHQSFTLQG